MKGKAGRGEYTEEIRKWKELEKEKQKGKRIIEEEELKRFRHEGGIWKYT